MTRRPIAGSWKPGRKRKREWRALKMIRPAAAVVILAAVAMCGIGQTGDGSLSQRAYYARDHRCLATVPTIAGRILRKRHSGG